MPSPAVVVGFDVLKQSQLCLVTGQKLMMPYELCFQCVEERLGDRIIPAVALPAHALNAAVQLESCPEILARILDTAIAVNQQSDSRPATHDCLFERHV